MDNIQAEASERLAHTLGKFTFTNLTEEERHAAFMLACTLPDGAVIKDFIVAASEAEVDRVGLPAEVARTLAPLVVRLESIAFAARFSSLFEARC
ncbi:hypothetical protein R70006_06195 [Paraburkholderia domus]|uniref:hypothetical protein n=1 Tax=Paraburkholderia domus TaxID=2793075 RepID=UPI0019134590|nr:hypothetical protein [Paraburkholderia domus]MBK5052827.1 hypothetical protein [Burkholderia sp. R-70006]CAE6820973.1 hypothetical protein R70006_06195 [Paraburkholderia domus]